MLRKHLVNVDVLAVVVDFVTADAVPIDELFVIVEVVVVVINLLLAVVVVLLVMVVLVVLLVVDVILLLVVVVVVIITLSLLKKLNPFVVGFVFVVRILLTFLCYREPAGKLVELLLCAKLIIEPDRLPSSSG